MGSARLFCRRDPVGSGGARNRRGRGLRQSLALVQRNCAAILGQHQHHHRIYAPHHQRAVVLFCRWTPRMDFCGNGPWSPGTRVAVAVVVFTLVEAILGALLVKLGLTAQSQSPLRPWYLALHLTNTLLLLAALTLTAHMLSRKRGYLRGEIRMVAPFGAIVGILVVLVVGVTGSLAALGDTLFPATSLGSALAQDFSSTSGWLVRWRWTHPTIAFLASIFLIWILVRAAQRTSRLGQSRIVRTGLDPARRAVCARAYSMWCCWLRCGCRSRISWVPMCCGPRLSCLPRD